MQMVGKLRRAVVSGGTGALGRALLSELSEREVSTLVLCRASSARSADISESRFVRKLDCPLDKMSELYLGDEKFDAFFHLAWEGTTGEAREDMYLQNLNVKHTLDAVALAARMGCGVFIGAGSQAEYGNAECALSSSTPAFPKSGYGMAKLCAGQMSRAYCRQLGVRHIWARILSIYGPFDGAQSLVSQAIDKISRGERASFTRGEQMWDYMYSADAAHVLFLLAERGRDGGVYCLGSGQARPLYEYIDIIRKQINPSARLFLGDIPYAEGQLMHLRADIEELVRDIGAFPITPFEKGIKRTLDSYNSVIRGEK